MREEAGMPYVVYHPKGLEPPYPAILFLHGRGESGTDGLRCCFHGIGSAAKLQMEDWPCLVVFPQKPDQDRLWPEHVENLNQVLTAVEAEFPIHETRRTITGLSQGGHGTLALASGLAWKFAAAAPVCGWMDDLGAARDLVDIPVWAFHGEADEVIPASRSIEAVEAIRETGGDAKLTLYPGVGHNSWDLAYRTEGLGPWLLSHG